MKSFFYQCFINTELNIVTHNFMKPARLLQNPEIFSFALRLKKSMKYF